MNRKSIVFGGIVVALLSVSLLSTSLLRGAPTTRPAPKPANPAFEAIKGLVGMWEVTSPKPKDPASPELIVFRSTAGGSAMIEVMFSRSDSEMYNMYTVDGDSILMTHYCMEGNQPRMRAKSIDKGVLKFEYVDASNLKSRDEAHMDSLEMTIDGDKVTEKWSNYADGKVTGTAVFELKRKK